MIPPELLNNKYHRGNKENGKHYWLTPHDLMESLQSEFHFDFDPCPYPKPEDFDGLTCEWGKSNYVNPPYGSIIHEGRKKGITAWVRKSIEEHRKGKRVVLALPVEKWILMLLAEGASVRNLGDVRWLATEDGKPGAGTGRHIACFILEPEPNESTEEIPQWFVDWYDKKEGPEFERNREHFLSLAWEARSAHPPSELQPIAGDEPRGLTTSGLSTRKPCREAV